MKGDGGTTVSSGLVILSGSYESGHTEHVRYVMVGVIGVTILLLATSEVLFIAEMTP